MIPRFYQCVAVLACLLFAVHSTAETVSFQLIPNAAGANDITPDGRYIVGNKISDGRPYRLDTVTNTMITLPLPGFDAVAVSDDGKVIVGDMPDPITGAEVAGMWTEQSGVWTSLGYLPNAQQCPSLSNSYEVNADGSVVVGLSWDGCIGRAFRWTQATGMVELEILANDRCRASVVSGDGTVIGGFAQGSFSRTPAVWEWNGVAGEGQLLDPPNGDAVGEIHGISNAGDVLLGEWNGDATRWTYPGLVRTTIGTGSILPGWGGIPTDVADAQGTVVGFDILMGNRRAWIQPNGTGPIIELTAYIEGFGGDVPDNIQLQVCQAITTDGRKIIGHGFGSGAWLVKITGDCPADIAPPSAGDGGVGTPDLLALINAWGQCPAPPTACPADLSPAGGDGMVGTPDLLALINAWGECPGAEGACCIDSACTTVTEAECLGAGGTYFGNSVPCTSTTCEFNDFCADAIDISANIDGAPVAGDNTNATPAPFAGPDTDLPVGSPSCQWNENPGAAHSTVWYSFIAPTTGAVLITTCGSSTPFSDSTLAVYSGTCGNLVEVACDEDNCMDPPDYPWYSKVEATGLTPGAVYYLCVMNPGEWGGSVPGEFVLTLTSLCPTCEK